MRILDVILQVEFTHNNGATSVLLMRRHDSSCRVEHRELTRWGIGNSSVYYIPFPCSDHLQGAQDWLESRVLGLDDEAEVLAAAIVQAADTTNLVGRLHLLRKKNVPIGVT